MKNKILIIFLSILLLSGCNSVERLSITNMEQFKFSSNISSDDLLAEIQKNNYTLDYYKYNINSENQVKDIEVGKVLQLSNGFKNTYFKYDLNNKISYTLYCINKFSTSYYITVNENNILINSKSYKKESNDAINSEVVKLFKYKFLSEDENGNINSISGDGDSLFYITLEENKLIVERVSNINGALYEKYIFSNIGSTSYEMPKTISDDYGSNIDIETIMSQLKEK